MKRIIKNRFNNAVLLAAFLLCAMQYSCESTQLEILDNPNAVSPQQSDIDFFLNSIQAGFIAQVAGNPLDTRCLNEFGMEVTRIMHMFGPTYQNAYDPADFDPLWGAVYSTALPDIRTMVPLAEEQELYTHVGIAKVLEALMMANLVDFFGDVPYSEATDGVNFPNPVPDPGAEIYANMLSLLDEAITDFSKDEVALPSNDRFYGGDEDKWIRLANTVKLKLYLQTRLVDNTVAAKINEILSSGNYIQNEDDDFQIEWSSNDTQPDSRHPEFGPNFDNGTGEYMNTTYMYWMVEEKGIQDPRWRYYFYRQSSENTTDVNEQSCITQSPPPHFGPNDIWCNFSNEGFWGRVHGDADGIPPDRGLRTTFGLYPVGGLFDDNSAQTITNRNIGLQGAGISPVLLSSYVDFMLAESALYLNTSGDARSYLETAVRKSIDKVINFSPENVDADLAATPEDINDYVDTVLSLYDSAGSQDERMAVIAKEYFIALWGNGIEAYNTYRRTGKPDLQPTELQDPGPFIRSFFYPASFADLNSNVEQKTDLSITVFWDTNPSGFID
ncbi:SusD/RagB family nutrient-binding outer membrane lipoprotein [Flagellimonas nanhaiensis]|nr:SusD/RagB family nutrient-binding outer membrane lipoprotein [Allomuricauda nanhaiensis]